MTFIEQNNDAFDALWNEYVARHPHASVYHHSFFRDAVSKTYGHKPVYLAAFDDHGGMKGALPLFILRRPLLGNELVSLPFCDYGGLLADNRETAAALFRQALEIAGENRCIHTELRQTYSIPYLADIAREFARGVDVSIIEATSKVGMRLAIENDAEELFRTFPSKLRSQIRKPQKQGLKTRIGGVELLQDFYSVFVRNMRDLGSPVHSANLMRNVLVAYPEKAKVFVIYKQNAPIACSLGLGFRNAFVNPWASFLREYRRDAPNMLLYWTMLEFAANAGYAVFDFGRSTREESTFRFKQQWGAQPAQLYWYSVVATANRTKRASSDSSMRETFEAVWRHLPIPVTVKLGPAVRKYISL